MFVLGHSPIDLVITDPKGDVITKDIWEVPGIAYYSEWNVGDDGDHNDAITVPELKNGDYLISAIPEPGALPTDTFTLEVYANGEKFILAENVQIRDISSKPYVIRVTDAGVEPVLDNIPPEIIITTPANGTSYVLNQDVLANWQAIDPESGIASAAATVSNGTAIDTATVGTKNFSVNATDNSGNQASKTVTYNVVYDFS